MSESIPGLSRNDTSVVLLLKVGNRRGVLLGADLEYVEDEQRGWRAAVAFAETMRIVADLVKIPHHGSDDAHYEGMWTVLLGNEPAAALAPYRSGGNELPRHTDRARIRGYTGRAYLTSDAPAPESADEVLLENLDDAIVTRLEGAVGHVRWRRSASADADWRVELDDASVAL